MKYDIAWVAGQGVARRHDQRLHRGLPRSARDQGSWEALVFYVNKEKTERIKKFATTRSGSRTTCPTTPKYRKPSVKGIVANAIDVVDRDGRLRSGDAGRHQPAERSSASASSTAASRCRCPTSSRRTTSRRPASMRSEFSWTPEEAERSEKFGTLAGELLTDMHEVIGHASGQQAAGFKGTPQAGDQGALLRAGGRTRRPGRPVLHGRPEARRARHRPRRRPGRRSCARSTRPTRATRSCSCGASARARRSKKTTCATAR